MGCVSNHKCVRLPIRHPIVNCAARAKAASDWRADRLAFTTANVIRVGSCATGKTLGGPSTTPAKTIAVCRSFNNVPSIRPCRETPCN
jgi:hypothetical protein